MLRFAKIPACLVLVCATSLVVTQASTVTAGVIPRSEESLPLAEAVRDQLPLSEATPEELLAGAMSQFYFFFPAGVATPITGRAQLDALVATTVLLEEAIRRGTTSYEHAHALFVCYAIMYATGRSGSVARSFQAQLDAAQGMSAEERQMMDLYVQTLGRFEEHGLAAAKSLGQLLIEVRPERTDVAYTLASIAEEQGDIDEAIRLYRMGLRDERYPERLLALWQLQNVSGDRDAAETRALATRIEPEIESAFDEMSDQAELRTQILDLVERNEAGRASESEQYELARLYREVGRLIDALEIYESLESWSGAPDDFPEEHAIAAMEANNPILMREILEVTRERSNPSARLLQLRLASESLSVVQAAMTSTTGLDLDEFFDSAEGQNLRDDLAAYRAIDADGARFVRVYLELITALVELRRSGSIEDGAAESIRRTVRELKESQPDNRSAYRFEIMLALYQRDRNNLLRALDAYSDFCDAHDCQADARRTAAHILIQTAANLGDVDLLENVDELLEDWPSDERDATYDMVRGTVALIRARIGRVSTSEQEELTERAVEAYHSALAHHGGPGQDTFITGADYSAIFNNLAYVAIEERDMGVAKLYLEAARRFNPSHPITLLNLGVTLASSQNIMDAFVTFSLGAAEAITDPAISFQLLRWAGHLYSVADRTQESLDAYRRALSIYEAGTEWTAAVDDGIHPGGPVEWGLLYLEDEGGLVVTLDLASPPMFFVPAPITTLEMSAAVEP